MKKLLLLFSITLLTIASASAQCTPDPQYTSPGIFPDSATGFAPACVGIPYEQIVTNVVPADTCVVVATGFPCLDVTIDSIVITSFTGLPAGFSYSCYDADNINSPADQCTFEGGTTGCVSIVGTPTAGDIGIHNLVINVDVYAGGSTSPQGSQVIDWYSIEVQDIPSISMNSGSLVSSNATGNQWTFNGVDISGATDQTYEPTANGDYTVTGTCGTSSVYTVNTAAINKNSTSSLRVFPNPANEKVNIEGANGKATVTVLNVNGTLVKTIEGSNNSNIQIDLHDLEQGVYFIKVSHASGIETVRIIKK